MIDDIDPRIAYYTRGETAYNFGDYLTDYFCQRMLGEPFVDAGIYRLIGSAISDAVIDRDLRGLSQDARISFWCCGARGDEGLMPELMNRCDFWGVRGPLTRDVLSLPKDTPLGDPGFLIPLIYQPKQMASLAGKTASMVHFSALSRSENLREAVGADVALSPSVDSVEALEWLFDQIASVDFLFTASLHGAIIACAFGVPFAFWDYGEIDTPFKWADTSALLGMSGDFHNELNAAKAWWTSQSGHIAKPALIPILAACPFTVRPSIWKRAFAMDAAAGHQVEDLVVGFEREDWRAVARARNQSAEASGTLSSGPDKARAELAAVLDKLAETTRFVTARQRAVHLDFRVTPSINFALDTPGNALLGRGWTPANNIAPWSLRPFGEMKLLAGSGWEEGQRLRLRGYLFAPSEPDMQRTITVFLNEVHAFEQTYVNDTDQPSLVIEMDVPIAPHLRIGRDLVIGIYITPIPSPAQLGLFGDDRFIGFAPLELTVI